MREHSFTNHPEHATYSIEEVADFISHLPNRSIVSRTFKIMKDRIIELTSYMDEVYAGTAMIKKGELPMRARYVALDNGFFDADSIPTCCVCNSKKVSIYESTVREHCIDKECLKTFKKEKAKRTNLERYGVEHTLQAKEVQEKAKKTLVDRYGVDNISKKGEFRRKAEDTMEERYGVRNAMHSEDIKAKQTKTVKDVYGTTSTLQDPEVKAKAQNTMVKKYGHVNPFGSKKIWDGIKKRLMDAHGVSNVSQMQSVKDKKSQTSMERYGVEHSLAAPEVRAKIEATNMERYGYTVAAKSNAVKRSAKYNSEELHGNGRDSHTKRHYTDRAIEILSDRDKLSEMYETMSAVGIAETLGVADVTVGVYLRNHGIEINSSGWNVSSIERQVHSFLDELGIEYKTGDRSIIGPKELDIVIPSHNLAIEINGAYWHSEKFGKDKYYHLGKTEACEEAGYRLIHIFDDEWLTKEDQIKRKLKTILGFRDGQTIYARKTEVRTVTSKEASPFYLDNHIQGSYKTKMNYALYYEGEMVACMSFKKNFGYMDLVRFATSCNVVGGFTKLVKAFLRDNPELDKLVSFADIRYSVGNVYESNGWELAYVTPPNYSYVVNGVRVKKQKFRKKHLARLLGDDYNPSLTENQIMTSLGIPKVWDCGLMKFELKRENMNL